MAKASGLGRTTVQRIWRALGLQPRRTETFKLSVLCPRQGRRETMEHFPSFGNRTANPSSGQLAIGWNRGYLMPSIDRDVLVRLEAEP